MQVVAETAPLPSRVRNFADNWHCQVFQRRVCLLFSNRHVLRKGILNFADYALIFNQMANRRHTTTPPPLPSRPRRTGSRARKAGSQTRKNRRASQTNQTQPSKYSPAHWHLPSRGKGRCLYKKKKAQIQSEGRCVQNGSSHTRRHQTRFKALAIAMAGQATAVPLAWPPWVFAVFCTYTSIWYSN